MLWIIHPPWKVTFERKKTEAFLIIRFSASSDIFKRGAESFCRCRYIFDSRLTFSEDERKKKSEKNRNKTGTRCRKAKIKIIRTRMKTFFILKKFIKVVNTIELKTMYCTANILCDLITQTGIIKCLIVHSYPIAIFFNI